MGWIIDTVKAANKVVGKMPERDRQQAHKMRDHYHLPHLIINTRPAPQGDAND